MTGDGARLLTSAEVLDRLRITRRTLYTLCANGELSFIPGRPVRFLAEEVDAYIQRKLTRKRPGPTKAATAVTEAQAEALARERRVARMIARMDPDEHRRVAARTIAWANRIRKK